MDSQLDWTSADLAIGPGPSDTDLSRWRVVVRPTPSYDRSMSVEHDEMNGGLNRLSARERQVLELTSRGMTNRQVALDLSISVHAVKFHLGGVYRKLGVANRTQATMLLYSHGYS